MPHLEPVQPRARQADLIVTEVADEVLVYDEQRHRAHALNSSAARVWRHCDGRTTVPELATKLQQELPSPVDEQIVWLALKELDRAHLLTERLPSGLLDEGLSRRKMLRRVGVSVAAGALLLPAVSSIVAPTPAMAQSPVACTTPTTITGSLVAGDPDLTNRVNRSDPPSTCAAPQPCLEAFNPGETFNFDAYTFRNPTASPQCVTVTLTPNCAEVAELQSAAYLGAVNTAFPCANFLGDIGNSPVNGVAKAYSFIVPAGTVFTVVVNNAVAVNVGFGTCSSYTLNVSCGAAVPPAIVTGTLAPGISPQPPPGGGSRVPGTDQR
jgi:hypothetical protein